MKKPGSTSLKVGDKIIPMRFCLYSIGQACSNLGISLEEFFEKFQMGADGKVTTTATLFEILNFYAECFKEAANYELPDDAVPYQRKHAFEWIEEEGFGSPKITAIVEALMASVTASLGIEGGAEGSKKKSDNV